MKRHQMDPVSHHEHGRHILEEILQTCTDQEQRVVRLANALRNLWPSKLCACLLTRPSKGSLCVLDASGNRQPKWEHLLQPELEHLAVTGSEDGMTVALSPEMGIAASELYVAPVCFHHYRAGVVAVALPKNDFTKEGHELRHWVDCLALLLCLEVRDRQQQIRWYNLADLANMVAHEFNNALNSIGLQIAVLDQKGLSVQMFPELATIRREVRTAGARARQLQEVCRNGHSNQGLIDLNSIIRSAVPNIFLQADPPLKLDLAPELSSVRGTWFDAERLVHLLLENARSASSSSEGQVIICTEQATPFSVRVRIEDTGPSVDPELLPRVFEPFLIPRPNSDSLRLALCRAVAKRMQGNIYAENSPGGGLALVVELPVATS